MTEREYERVKVRLNRYRELRGRVGRLAEEAVRWNAMAELSAPDLRQAGGGRGSHRDMGAIKASALAIEEERDQLAREAMEERRRLMDEISGVEDAASRDILERVYIGGATVREVASLLEISEKTVLRKLCRAAGLLAQKENR